MHTDHVVIRISSDRVANKDEQWLSNHETDCEQNDRRLWKHYLSLRSVKIMTTVLDVVSKSVKEFQKETRKMAQEGHLPSNENIKNGFNHSVVNQRTWFACNQIAANKQHCWVKTSRFFFNSQPSLTSNQLLDRSINNVIQSWIGEHKLCQQTMWLISTVNAEHKLMMYLSKDTSFNCLTETE